METAGYDRLTALDASFLTFENANVHMHVGAVAIFEAEPLCDDDGHLDFEAIRALVERSLPAVPRFRQRLTKIPVFDYPVWIDHEQFNLDYHVRHTALPPPGDERRLKRLAGRILSQKLDRGKPLWEIWVVEGLEGGRFALIVKAHHCMVDGIGGLDVLTAILRLEPGVDEVEEVEWKPRRPASDTKLFVDELWRRGSAPLEFAKQARRALENPRKAVADLRSTLQGVSEFGKAGMVRAADSRLNVDVGQFRRFDWAGTSLSEVSEVRRRYGGTINDVALAVAAGAIGDYLSERGETFDDESFRIQFPVSTRPAGDSSAGNQVAMLLAPLPIGEPDPVERLRKVIAITDDVKHSGQQEGLDVISQISDRVLPELTGFFSQLAVKQRPFNVVVTNIPGPRDPVYLLTAQMTGIYPLVPLLANQTLGIALFSYHGRLQWGLHADWDAVPDLHDLAEGIDRQFSALLERARAE